MRKDDTNTGKKRKKENSVTNTSASRKRCSRTIDSAPEVFYQEYCELPFTLCSILVDEYEYITRNDFGSPRSVHALPARVSVKQVLQHYQRKRSDSESKERIRKFCEGLALLFDDALPICLLYREERPQYESLQTDESLRLKRSCEIYGTTFLLRLLRRLPILLREESQNEMDDVGPLIADLIVLLQKNRQACFKESYRQPKEHELLECEKRIVLPTVGRTL